MRLNKREPEPFQLRRIRIQARKDAKSPTELGFLVELLDHESRVLESFYSEEHAKAHRRADYWHMDGNMKRRDRSRKKNFVITCEHPRCAQLGEIEGMLDELDCMVTPPEGFNPKWDAKEGLLKLYLVMIKI